MVMKGKNSLPWIRFTTVATFIVAVDSIACVALWIAGGNSKYLEHNVEDFSLIKSTFDLACVAAVRGVILIALLYLLERAVISHVSLSAKTRKRTANNYSLPLQILILLLSFACLSYAAVKIGLVVHEWKEGRHMHVTYKVLCITAAVFPLVELMIGVASFYFMKRLRTQQVMLIVNETEGQEQDEMTDEQKSKSSFRAASLRRLLLMAKPEYGMMGVGIIFLFISCTSSAAAPYFFGKVIDYAIPNTNCSSNDMQDKSTGPCVKVSMDKMNHEVLLLVILFVIGSGAALVRSWLFNLAGYRFVSRLRKRLFAAVMRQEIGFFDVTRTGELTNRLSSDTQLIQNAVTVNISMLVRYLLQIVISLVLMFWQSARLTAVLLSVVPIIAIGATQYGRLLKSLQKDFQDKLANASSTAEESISNVRTVRFFSNENKMVSSYSVDIDESYKLGRKLSGVTGVFTGVVFFLAQGAAALVLWYGGYLVYHSQLSPGALTSLMLYTLNLAMAFGFLSSLYGDFMKAVGASVRVFELLDRHSAVTDGRLQLGALKGEIQFDDVMFNYPSRPDNTVLKGVSFTVQPGQVVALVGPSGGGKSTIVNLIERFYDLQAGNIYLSGHNLADLDPVWFRHHIGIVSQEPVLFACSISDNISFGREDATHEEIVEAAKQANAHDFISSFDEEYNTMVGERGVRLSGGQKQRIAIARALLLDPAILLLDEATSALDAESEHLVQEAIDRAMKGRTVLVIAHRLSTVRNASQVVVINKGSVVERGTHNELLAAGGVYRRLVLRQLNAGNTNENSNMDWTDPANSHDQ